MAGAVNDQWHRRCTEAACCRMCPGVEPKSAVLGPANGPVPCDWLFVGEAPGRLGAGRTGVPFNGDKAGRRFEALLAEAGLDRSEVFVTNAVLCLPLDDGGRNRRPRYSEVANCLGHLRRTVEVVRPRIVVAMGAVALEALGRIEPHGLSLRFAAQPVAWYGRTLVAVYHPGWRAEAHRAWEHQRADWRRLGGDGQESHFERSLGR